MIASGYFRRYPGQGLHRQDRVFVRNRQNCADEFKVDQMQITDAMKGLNSVAFEQAAQELARERGIQLDDPRRPYTALCEWEKTKAMDIAKKVVNSVRNGK